MIIRANMSSIRANQASKKTRSEVSKNLEKLSSGFRINRAGDDAAGLSMSEKMRAEITELDRCQKNVTEGLDLARTAEGALEEINEMLRRARELCIEAANGTYSELERASISDEINQLFSEIDRITASSTYNSIPLFRGDISGKYHEEYDESFDELSPDQLELWGQMEFVRDKSFDPAAPAKAATASFQLNSSVNLADAKSLEGMSLRAGSYTYYFTSNPQSSLLPENSIDLKTCTTVEDALQALKTCAARDRYSVIGDISLADDGTVTITAKLSTLTSIVSADGKNLTYLVPNGNGEFANGQLIQNAIGYQTIGQVDGSGAANNQPVYSSACQTSFTLPDTFPLTQERVDQINKSDLYYLTISHSLAGTNYGSTKILLDKLTLTAGMTKDEMGQALVEAINKQSTNSVKYKASYDGGTVSLELEVVGYDGPLSAYVQEYKPSSSAVPDTAHRWTSTSLNITTQTTSGGLETGPTVTFTVPQSMNVPFSFRFGSSYYLYYDSTDPNQSLNSKEYPNTSYSTSKPTLVDVSKLSGSVYDDVFSKVLQYAQGIKTSYPSSIDSVTTSGNTITIKGNVGASISTSVYGASITVTPTKTAETTSSYVVTNGSTKYFTQAVETSFNLGSNAAGLVGKGFSFNGRQIEFTDGTGGLSSGYTDVDISKCANLQEVADLVQAIFGNSYKVTLDSSNNMTISFKKSTSSYSYITVTDGVEGITDGTPVSFSGGVNVGHSQTILDFSSINESNLDTLLGKGFRINCATCSGEYINVFFCWENDGSMPEEFQRLDESTGEIRTIHNIPVELSKVTSGDKIVENIVNQVRPSLTHYTDLAIGDPPTILIAMEKRPGDVIFDNELYLGQVQTGMEVNFTYTLDFKNVADLPEDGSVQLCTTDVQIYVGSHPQTQIIPVHLPYIDLEWLRLSPPETVDLNADNQDAADWLSRVDAANIAISMARGTLGADYNRLEHAYAALAVADEALTDAESLIRDADMAELMVDNVKSQILSQAQQTMMAQANSQPQQVLQLLG